MEWSTVIAALAGAVIGVLAELSGKISARRDAAREQAIRRSEAQEDRERALHDEDRGRKRDKSEKAALRILKSFLNNSVALGFGTDEDLTEECSVLIRRLHVDLLLISDPKIRRRLAVGRDALDLAVVFGLSGYRTDEVVFIVRRNVSDWLGTYLRGDPLGHPDDDWVELEQETLKAMERWQISIAQKGYRIRLRALE